MVRSEVIEVDGFDEVYRVECGGAVAFVTLHTVLAGHSFGGIRIHEYDGEQAALDDAKALAVAMSRKVVMAGIAGGGGKTVLAVPTGGEGFDRETAIRELGEFVESLGGRYCCGPDYGFTEEDGEVLRGVTQFVAPEGLATATAQTVEIALRAVVPQPDTVAVQGLGAVGLRLAMNLKKKGVVVVGADMHPVPGFEYVDPEEIYETPCDVFAPCAMGGVLDDFTIPLLHTRVVCGGANNPIATDEDADRLHARGITFIPDILSNSGATILGASTQLGQEDKVKERMAGLKDRVLGVLERAKEEDRSPVHVVREMADELIERLRAAV